MLTKHTNTCTHTRSLQNATVGMCVCLCHAPAECVALVAAALYCQTIVIRATVQEGTPANITVRRDNGIMKRNANGDGERLGKVAALSSVGQKRLVG